VRISPAVSRIPEQSPAAGVRPRRAERLAKARRRAPRGRWADGGGGGPVAEVRRLGGSRAVHRKAGAGSHDAGKRPGAGGLVGQPACRDPCRESLVPLLVGSLPLAVLAAAGASPPGRRLSTIPAG